VRREQSSVDGRPEARPKEAATRSCLSCPPCPVPCALRPGDVFFSRQPAQVVAVLGSCVAVALWDPESGAGGMNHYLLPRWRGGAVTAKYGDVANVALVARFEKAGLPLARLRAKVFGGACVMKALCDRPSRLCEENVAAARDFLAAHGIAIDEEHVSGTKGMRVLFDTSEGTASVRRLGR
jgi:chemotaxis protein CheD